MTSETEVTLTNALEKVVGPTFVTLSYAASRVRRLMRPELGCDLRLYAGVLGQYEVSISVMFSTRDSHRVTGAALPAGHILRAGLETGGRAANLQQVSKRVLSTEKSDVINYILVPHYPINMQGNC